MSVWITEKQRQRAFGLFRLKEGLGPHGLCRALQVTSLACESETDSIPASRSGKISRAQQWRFSGEEIGHVEEVALSPTKSAAASMLASSALPRRLKGGQDPD